jgi:hypothetical protein
MRTAALACLVSIAAAAHLSAQTTIGAVAGASRQAAGASDLPYLGPPFGGTTAAFIGLIDFPISDGDAKRSMSFGAEASVSGATSGDQSQRSSATTYAFTSRHRDSIFSGTFKLGLRSGRAQAAAVVGAGGAYRRTAREGTSAPLIPPSARSDYSAVVSNFVPAYSFGGDVAVRLTDRLRLLALARWHFLRDDDRDDNGVVKRGVSSRLFRAGAGAAWRF